MSEATQSDDVVEPEPAAPPPTGGRLRRLVRKPATRWFLASVVVLLAVVGVGVWRTLQPVLTAVQADDVTYKVPSAPHLAANPGETVYRIDPTRSKVSYAVDENIVGQTASRASGSTNGIAGDLTIDATTPASSRVGQIVVDVEQLHSDNNLRDARIRQDFLESHANPLAQFTTDSLSGMPTSITDGQAYDFTIVGQLAAHGQTTPVTWTAHGTRTNDQLTITATTKVKMSALGIGPISLAGLVTTGDDVDLTLDVVAVNPSKVTIPDQIAAPVSDQQKDGPAPSFQSAVAPILAKNCASCHATGQVGAAHWVLDTAGDASKVADGIGTVTQSKYMPPWPASNVGVPLDHSKALSQSDIDTIASWSEHGGPLDVPASTPLPPTPNPATVQPRHDVNLQMPDAYTGSLDHNNDYRCFVLDPKFTAPTYVTGYEVTPGVREEIHHVQIFHISAAQVAASADVSGKDGKPGWSCYGGPALAGGSPTATAPDGAGASGRARGRGGFSLQPGLIAGWVPGQDPSVYPQDSGILMEPGDALVLQVHYHYEDQPTPDQTSVALQTAPGTDAIRPIEIVNPLGPVEIPCLPGTDAPLCDRNAALAENNQLYGPTGSSTEAGLLLLCRQTPESLTQNFTGVATSTCDSRVPTTGTIVADMGHMHTLGKSFRLTLAPDRPEEKVLLDIPTWNFDWQMNYQLQTPVHVNAGDTIRMTCTWDRSLDPNRAPKYIVFAEGTEDEMCFSTYALIPDK